MVPAPSQDSRGIQAVPGWAGAVETKVTPILCAWDSSPRELDLKTRRQVKRPLSLVGEMLVSGPGGLIER